MSLCCYRSEAAIKKTDDARKAREVAQLKKETRKKEHRIKSLEADAKRREVVLRRRAEEVRRRGAVNVRYLFSERKGRRGLLTLSQAILVKGVPSQLALKLVTARTVSLSVFIPHAHSSPIPPPLPPLSLPSPL